MFSAIFHLLADALTQAASDVGSNPVGVLVPTLVFAVVLVLIWFSEGWAAVKTHVGGKINKTLLAAVLVGLGFYAYAVMQVIYNDHVSNRAKILNLEKAEITPFPQGAPIIPGYGQSGGGPYGGGGGAANVNGPGGGGGAGLTAGGGGAAGSGYHVLPNGCVVWGGGAGSGGGAGLGSKGGAGGSLASPVMDCPSSSLVKQTK
jgi:hypothetical protein